MSRYTCDITVFDKQTNMAEREGKPSKHGGQIARHPQVKQCGSKISVNHSHIRSPEQEKLGGASARATAMLSNTVTGQAQLSSPVSRDTFIWKLAVFWLQKIIQIIFLRIIQTFLIYYIYQERRILLKKIVSYKLKMQGEL